MNSQPTKTEESKAPQAMAASAFGALAALTFMSGVSVGPLAFLAKVPELALWSSGFAGIHSACQLKRDDYVAGIDLGWKCLTLGARRTGVQQTIAPVAQAAKSLPGFEDIDRTTPFDVSEILTKSAMVVAPTGTGKSFLLSLILCEQERLYPDSVWMVASKNNFKRQQNWAGLKDCPEWLQRKKLAFGWKYLNESSIEIAAHRETNDAVDSLWAEMQRRMKLTMDSKGECGEFPLNRLWIDEFPSYWSFLEKDEGDDDGIFRRDKIKDLLATGHGYQSLLGVISVDDAVNKIGLQESDKRQLMFVRPFKPEAFATEPKDCGLSAKVIEMVNRIRGRRLLLQFNGVPQVMPIPHCEHEPRIDWSQEIERGEMRTLIDALAMGEMRGWKQFGSTITAAWSEFTQHTTFKGNKKQSEKENETYVYFKKKWEGIEL